MVKLADTDVRTREVLSWTGLHLFHAQMSSCSQKVRICLNLKGIDWISHPLDVLNKENLTDYYMGINPRGLVPTLVHDGAVHIESNDILVHLEQCFPEPVLIPPGQQNRIGELLKHEDDLHMALRTVSFRFMISPSEPPKSAEDLANYERSGSGTVSGIPDAAKQRESRFWQQFLDGGIPDPVARDAVLRFRDAFNGLDRTLRDSRFIVGDSLSVVDIAWCVYVNRLWLCGYPFARLHASLWTWFEALSKAPAFDKELAVPANILNDFRRQQMLQSSEGKGLEQVAGLRR